MPNARDTYRDIMNATNNGVTKSSVADSAAMSYIRCHCYHPQKVKVYDAHAASFILKDVPCGCCYHCRQSKINEWVTRLYAHCESYKYIYFTTLTYRSFEKERSPYTEYLFNYLQDCYFHYDSFNESHRPCYSPCRLEKSHYQNFFKRLRRYNNLDLTYFGCGEYGHKYGRPHWHFIIFSKQPITARQIHRAWGLVVSTDDKGTIGTRSTKNSTKKRFMSFGRIEHDDLVTNGTLSSINLHGERTSGKLAFTYVAKYIGKKEFNNCRLRYYLDDIFTNNNNPNSHYYEPYKITSEDPAYTRTALLRKNAPFIAVSRGTPIGSLYIKSNIAEMAAGKFPTPPLQTSSFVVPAYFRRKAAESIYSLRRITQHGCVGKIDTPTAYAIFNTLLPGCISDSIRHSLRKVPEATTKIPISTITKCTNLKDLLNSPNALVDVVSRHRFLIEFNEHKTILYVHEYANNRAKGWIHVSTMTLHDFCKLYLTGFATDFTNYLEQNQRTKESEYYYDLIQQYYKQFSTLPDYKESIETFSLSKHSPSVNYLAKLIEDVEKLNDSYITMQNVSRYQQTNI